MTDFEKHGSLQTPAPDPALKRLEVLVGGWRMKGRTLDSQEDDVVGELSGGGSLAGSSSNSPDGYASRRLKSRTWK